MVRPPNRPPLRSGDRSRDARARGTPVALVVALVALSVFTLPTGAVPDARISITSTTVTPGTVVTGSPVTVEATVANAAGSTEAIDVDEVALRTVLGEELVVERNLGALSPGGSLTVPLTETFALSGERRLEVVVTGTDEDGDTVTVRRPVVLTVEQAPPQVEVRPSDGVVGVETRAQVVVSNPTTEPMRNLAVTLTAEGAEPLEDRRLVPTIAAGTSTVLNVSYRPTAPTTTLDVSVDYTSSTGTRGSVSQRTEGAVTPLVDDVGVRVAPVVESDDGQPLPELGQLGTLIGGGGQTTQPDATDDGPDRMEVVVTNFGNAPITDVVVRARAGDPLPRQSVGTIAPGDEGVVVVSLAGVSEPGTVDVDVTYRVVGTAGVTGTATGAFDYRPGEGRVSVTGVSLSVDEDGVLTLSGNLGNTGDADISGVVVAVGTADGIEPSYPQRDYFVGTVESSEFAPFDLTARVDTERATADTRIPVTVSYRTGGVERTETVELPYDPTVEPEDDEGGFPLWVAALLVGLVVVPAAVVVARSR